MSFNPIAILLHMLEDKDIIGNTLFDGILLEFVEENDVPISDNYRDPIENVRETFTDLFHDGRGYQIAVDLFDEIKDAEAVSKRYINRVRILTSNVSSK